MLPIQDLPPPENVSKKYEERERKRLEVWAKAFKPLPVEQQSLVDRLTAAAPWAILHFAPDALKKAEDFLRKNDITFPLMGTVFKLLNWGFSFLRTRFRIE